jgi:DNA invertase Pin-like site-specific DNA recombinase
MAGFVSYARVSTTRQGESGLGLQAQREAVARHLGGNPLIAEFIEVESGKSDRNRPQLLAALAECKRKKATLVIAKLDRLSRNLAFIATLMESDVEFVCCDNPHATKTLLRILAVFAQHEREMISDRTKQALAAAKARGTKLGNPRWRESLAKARKVKDPTPIPPGVIAMMQELRTNGLTFREIAAKLNGVNSYTPKKKLWYAGTVRMALLRAPAQLAVAA